MTDTYPRVGLIKSIARALVLSCPRCGSRGVLAGWFRLRDSCPVCSLALRRAPDADDEWFGGYFMNLMTSELLMLFVVIGYVLLHWPGIQWQTVEVLSVVMVIVSPVISYPFAKMLWVAIEYEFASRGETKSRRQ